MALNANEELFLEWLLDDRPEGLHPLLEVGGVHLSADSEHKGTATGWAIRHGLHPNTPANVRRRPQFQDAYRKAVQDEVRDPSHMLDIVRRLRAVAKGSTGSENNPTRTADELKAAELYARLTGYEAPAAPEAPRSAKDMTDEELAAAQLAKLQPKVKHEVLVA